MTSCTRRWKHPSVSGRLFFSILLGMTFGLPAAAQQSAPVHLTLDQAIDLAVKQNRSIHLRSLSVDEMRSKKDEARSNYLPQMKTTGSVLHITELSGVEIPAGSFGNFLSTGPVPSRSLFLDQGSLTSYTDGVGLDQPLTQLFRIHQANIAAKRDVLVAQAQLDETQDDVALNARQLYYSILINQNQLQASQAELEAARVKDAENRSDVERGNALEIASFQSQAAILNAQQNSLALKLQGDDLRRQLADLLGMPVGTAFELDSNIPVPSMDLPSREDAIQQAMNENPELRAARETLEKAKAGLAAAKDAYIPDVTALSRYSYQSGVPFLEHNFGTFGFTLSYDLFDGGKREAQIRDARSSVMSARVAVENLESQINVQVQAAYDRVEQVRQLVDVAQQVVKVRTEAARLADRQFEQNEALSSARSQAHADLANANASLLEASLQLSLAEAGVKKTIGQLPR
jgi:outer membrane protein TolC